MVSSHLYGLVHVQTLERHVLHVPELGHQLLVAGEGLVEPDVVHGNLGRVDEADRDLGGVEAGQIQPDQEVTTRVHFD